MCPKRVCISTVGVRKDLYPKDPYKVPITDFFGSIRPTEITAGVVNVTLSTIPEEHFAKKPISKPNLALFYEQFPSELFA